MTRPSSGRPSRNRGPEKKKKERAGGGGAPASAIGQGWWIALIFVAGFALYIPSLRYDFVFDDHALVVENVAVKQIDFALRDLAHFRYRPARTLSYAVDYKMGGMTPWVFHLSNLFWHLLVLAAAWLVLREIVADPWVTRLALFFFALHPVHIDAVAYISGRRDLLSAFFTLVAFYAYVRFTRDRRLLWWPLILVAGVLAFLSKEMGIIVPFLLLLYDWSRRVAETPAQSSWKGLSCLGKALRAGWWYYGIMAVGAVLAAGKIVTGSYSGRFTWWGGTLLNNLLTGAKLLCNDLFLMVFPFNLKADYSYDAFPVARSPLDLVGWLAAAGVVLLLWLFFRTLARGHFQGGFWGGWFVVCLIPVLQLVPHHELFAEHYLYLSSLGFCVLLAWGLRALSRRSSAGEKILRWAAVGVLGGVALFHMGVYADEISLRTDVLEKAPRCVRANLAMGDRYFNEGRRLFSAGDPEGARTAFQSALPYYQQIRVVPPEYVLDGISPEKLAQLRQLDLGGDAVMVHRDIMSHARAIFNLGNIYESLSQPEEAEACYLDALKLGHLPEMVCDRLGSLKAESGRLEEALGWFAKALAIKPANAELQTNSGVACCGLKRWAEARQHLEAALGVNPQFSLAHYYLAQVLLQTNQDRNQAANHLRQALALKLDGRLVADAKRQLEILDRPVVAPPKPPVPPGRAAGK